MSSGNRGTVGPGRTVARTGRNRSADPVRDVLLPYAHDFSDRLVDARVANQELLYWCPTCGELVTLRRGPKRRAHFAHHNATCETNAHLLAKLLVAQIVNDFVNRAGPAPVLIRRCRRCPFTHEQALPSRVTEARVEQRTDSGHVVDVGLFDCGSIVAGVEVRASHPVDDAKAESLRIAWFELDAFEVLDDPLRWRFLREGKLISFNCPACAEQVAQRQRASDEQRARIEAERERAQAVAPTIPKLKMPGNAYLAFTMPCYRCKKPLVLFDWDRGTWDKQRPPDPRPHTIRNVRIHSLGGRRMWCNICPFCRATIGNDFLNDDVRRILGEPIQDRADVGFFRALANCGLPPGC